MHSELINLLPVDRQRSLARNYFLRLSIVLVLLFTGITLVAGVLLIPTYVLLAASSSAKATRLENIKSTLSSTDETMLSARLTTLSNNIATLTALANGPSASTIVRTMLAVSRPGITISSFDYTPAVGESVGKLLLTGTAGTRDALRNYQLALQGVPFVQSADLPISAYAKDTNISFAITMTLTP